MYVDCIEEREERFKKANRLKCQRASRLMMTNRHIDDKICHDGTFLHGRECNKLAAMVSANGKHLRQHAVIYSYLIVYQNYVIKINWHAYVMLT